MRLQDTPSEAAFRAELRAWLAATLPGVPPEPGTGAGNADHDDWTARRAYDTAWQRTLSDAGYAGIAWPAEHGGRGASPSEELIFLEETERARAPYVGCNFVGTLHAGPTLIAEGTPEQQAAHLPGILRGDHVWCQGFSEPDAGSDLASLRTRGIRDGDHYVVTGHKIWTSHAQVADYCELLVRTDTSVKHKGITWLIMPMDSPGIELQPLRTLTGVSEFNEMFLDEVRIPVANRVGAENDGWRVAMVTFSFERGTAFVSELLRSMVLAQDLVDVARKTAAWDDGSVRRDMAIVVAELDALWALTRRNVSRAARSGSGGVGVGGSVFKLGYHETRERLGEVALRVLGRAGLAMGDPAGLASADHVEQRLYALSLSIAAGTAQIQRNIVGERLLGLPKER
jgi:alkylation response protein AidB-like acyl-CoA dehydrogenase